MGELCQDVSFDFNWLKSYIMKWNGGMPDFMLSCSSSCSFYFCCFSSFPILFTCCWLCTVNDFLCSSLFCSTTLILSSWSSLTCTICSSIAAVSLDVVALLLSAARLLWFVLHDLVWSVRSVLLELLFAAVSHLGLYLSLLEVFPECSQSVCLSVPDTLEIHLAALIASLQTLGLASCSQMPSVPSVFECCLQCVSPCLASEASQCTLRSQSHSTIYLQTAHI